MDRKKVLQHLSFDGEDCYQLTEEPLLLLIAYWILVDCIEYLVLDQSSYWWSLRCLFLIQKTLENPSSSLLQSCHHMISLVNKNLPSNDESNWELLARWKLECHMVYQFYNEDKKALEQLKAAQEITGLKWDMTGLLGKRTRFQKNEIAQLFLNAESVRDRKSELLSKTKQIKLNDDQLLENISYSEKTKNSNLHPLDQCILIAFWFSSFFLFSFFSFSFFFSFFFFFFCFLFLFCFLLLFVLFVLFLYFCVSMFHCFTVSLIYSF